MITGPFETVLEAMAASGWERAGRPFQRMRERNAADLAEALAGIELGAYDRRILDWLAGAEPAAVAVICGLISRARAAPG